MYIYLNGAFHHVTTGARSSVSNPTIRSILNKIIRHVVSRDGYIKKVVFLGNGIEIQFSDLGALDLYSLKQAQALFGDHVDIQFNASTGVVKIFLKPVKQDNIEKPKQTPDANEDTKASENTEPANEQELPVYTFEFTKDKKSIKNPDIEIPCIITAKFDQELYSHVLVIYKDKSRDAIAEPDGTLKIEKPVKKLVAVSNKKKKD